MTPEELADHLEDVFPDYENKQYYSYKKKIDFKLTIFRTQC